MKLSINEVAFLSEKYKEKGLSPISLFANVNAQFDGSERKTLEEKGVYANGHLSARSSEMLDIAANAKMCSRIALKDSSCVVEKYAYKIGEKKILVENDGGDLLFSMPEKWSETVAELSEFTGMSRIKNSDFEILLNPLQMMVLLAVIDITRENALISYIGNTAPSDANKLESIVQHLENPGINSLVNMLKKNYNYGVPEANEVEPILGELTAKGCVKRESGYCLQGEYLVFANSFLVPETIVILEAFNASENGTVTTGAALCVCAGIKDIASFIFSPEGIELSAISGMQLMQIIENFLNCPEISA